MHGKCASERAALQNDVDAPGDRGRPHSYNAGIAQSECSAHIRPTLRCCTSVKTSRNRRLRRNVYIAFRSTTRKRFLLRRLLWQGNIDAATTAAGRSGIAVLTLKQHDTVIRTFVVRCPVR